MDAINIFLILCIIIMMVRISNKHEAFESPSNIILSVDLHP